MIIKVLDHHISSGLRNNCYHCPVARAIHDATGKPCAVVSNKVVVLDGQWIDLPKFVREFVNDFDTGRGVTPFEFELYYPPYGDK